MTRRDLYATGRWQRTRLRVLNRDGWKCRDCGVGAARLEVHHERRDVRLFFDMDNLATLCEPCHKRRHGRHEADPAWTALVREI